MTHNLRPGDFVIAPNESLIGKLSVVKVHEPSDRALVWSRQLKQSKWINACELTPLVGGLPEPCVPAFEDLTAVNSATGRRRQTIRNTSGHKNKSRTRRR